MQTVGGLKQTFKIPQNENRLRIPIVHAGFEFPVQIYRYNIYRGSFYIMYMNRMDGGDFTIISTDSSRIDPIIVSDMIAGIGETYIIEFDFPLNIQSITIRAQLLAECKGQSYVIWLMLSNIYYRNGLYSSPYSICRY